MVTVNPVRLALALLLATLAATLLAVPASRASTKVHECQKPVRTGVDVSGLHNVTPAIACPPALALFHWENQSAAHIRALYGCRRPKPDEAGTPYLRLHSFHSWKLSLSAIGSFTMSRGESSFYVSGTDFPLNCT